MTSVTMNIYQKIAATNSCPEGILLWLYFSIFLWLFSSMNKEGHSYQWSGVAWNKLVLCCGSFVSGGRIILHTNVQVLPEGSEICRSASKACVCRSSILANVLYTPNSCQVWNGAGCDRFPRDSYVQICPAISSPVEGWQGDPRQAEAPGLSFACIRGGLHYLCSLGIRAVAYDYFILFYFINNYIL